MSTPRCDGTMHHLSDDAYSSMSWPCPGWPTCRMAVPSATKEVSAEIKATAVYTEHRDGTREHEGFVPDHAPQEWPSSPANTPHAIETFSGRFVDTKKPDPATIVLEDVAHALASICRFGGHSKRFYSVAEHAVYCSVYMERRGAAADECLAALHHDDPEAFLGDIPRPLKPLLGAAYRRLSERMDVAIVQGLALPFGAEALHTARIKEADNAALVVEAAELMPSRGAHWFENEVYINLWEIGLNPGDLELPDYWRGGLSPAEAEGLYLSRHWELTT